MSKHDWAFIGMQFGIGLGWSEARLAEGQYERATVAFGMAFIFAWVGTLIARRKI